MTTHFEDLDQFACWFRCWLFERGLISLRSLQEAFDHHPKWLSHVPAHHRETYGS
jgi:hypothetical protein